MMFAALVTHSLFFFLLHQAINVVSVSCGSVIIVFTVLGSSPALVSSALAVVLSSAAPGGALHTTLGVTQVGPSIFVSVAAYAPLSLPLWCGYGSTAYCATATVMLSYVLYVGVEEWEFVH